MDDETYSVQKNIDDWLTQKKKLKVNSNRLTKLKTRGEKFQKSQQSNPRLVKNITSIL